MSEDEFVELAAGHALHALDASEEQALEAAMLEHPEWVRHVTAALETSARLADLTAPVTPPAAVRAELLARIAAPAAAPLPARRRHGSRLVRVSRAAGSRWPRRSS